MSRFKWFYFFLLIIWLNNFCHAQDQWMIKGYLKGLTTMQTAGDNGELSLENTLHNRFDINWFASDRFSVTAGVRNRIIIGNNVSLIPNYSEYVSRDEGYFDLSILWADQTSWLGLTQFDRLMIDYSVNNFQITVGRQRINWGQTYVWNPNDLYNTYSYFDFDYEERPGTDAIRLQYYLDESSKLELSGALNSEGKITSLLLYRMNTRGFDLQFLGGIFTESDLVIGGGFSGSIGGGGFSGELTYFNPLSTEEDQSGQLTATLHYDYTFANSFNLQFETLYNGFGADDFSSGIGDILFQQLSPKNLFPTKFAMFGSGAYDLSPLLRLMMAGMYGPEGNFFYIGPTLSYSMSDSLELAGIGQYFSMDQVYDQQGIPLLNSGTAIYFRLKWSF